MYTTLNKIREHDPCEDGWAKLLSYLGKTTADDEPLSITTIIDSNGVEDAIWCLRAVEGHDKEIRLFAVWCARQVQHLMADPRSLAALDVAERFANGEATEEEREAAGTAAWDAVLGATGLDAAEATAWATTWAKNWATAWDAPWPTAESAAEYAAEVAARDAAKATGWGAAWAAARKEQEQELRRICAEVEAKQCA